MKLSNRWIVVLFLMVAALLFTASIANQDQALAAEYGCQAGTTCPNASKCTGSHYVPDGCSITCYREEGGPVQRVFSGSAKCGTGGDMGVY